MVATYARSGGVWQKAKKIFVRNGGLWKPVKKAWVGQGGAWKLAYQQNARMVDVLTEAGLVTSPALGLCLDMGDSGSVAVASPVPQTILDVSGAGYNFWNGMTTAINAYDFAFVGTPGGLSMNEFLRNTGSGTGQATQAVLRGAVANPSWAELGHRNNAAFTVAGWFYLAAAGDNRVLFATSEIFWTNDPGWAFVAANGALHYFARPAGSGTQQSVANAAFTISLNAWHFLAMSMNEASGTIIFQVDGTQVQRGPSAFSLNEDSGAEDRMTIGANVAGHWSTLQNSQINTALGWAGTMSASQLLAAYNATKFRFEP